MPRFYFHFAADPFDPNPPVSELTSIEAESPLAAAGNAGSRAVPTDAGLTLDTGRADHT
jgi:hypothetical protein